MKKYFVVIDPTGQYCGSPRVMKRHAIEGFLTLANYWTKKGYEKDWDYFKKQGARAVKVNILEVY